MLSVVITAWNEAPNLARAVRSVSGLADEVVVVDTESTDDTVKIAKSLGCKVFRHANTRIVEPVRNFSISKASGDWILLLDADEEVTPSLASEIRQIIAGNKYDFCRLPRQNIIFGHWITTGHWWPDYVYRLFKKGSVTWQDTIHSVPRTVGTGYDFPGLEKFALVHHNYSSISQYLDRLNRYTDIQSQSLISSDYRFVWPDLVTKPAAEFFTQYFARHGYSMGLHGLALSLLQAVSELAVYLKVWQAAGFSAPEFSSSDVDKVFSGVGRDFLWWSYESRLARSNNILSRLYLKLTRRLNRFFQA